MLNIIIMIYCINVLVLGGVPNTFFESLNPFENRSSQSIPNLFVNIVTFLLHSCFQLDRAFCIFSRRRVEILIGEQRQLLTNLTTPKPPGTWYSPPDRPTTIRVSV